MPVFPKIKRRYFYLAFFLLLLISFFAFKDRLALGLAKLVFKKAMSNASFNVSGLVVWPGYIEVKDFEVRQVSSGIEKFKADGGRGVLKFSTLSLLGGPLMAVREGSLSIQALRIGEASISDIALRALRNASGDYLDSVLEIRSASFKKGKARDFKGTFRIGRDYVVFDEFGGLLLGGLVSSSGRLSFGKKTWNLDSRVHFDRAELIELLKAFQAEKGVKASGAFSGDITMVIEDGKLTDLKGRLDSVSGGDFIITDASLLGSNLKGGQGRQRYNGGQAANIVVENLKNYHYDIGNIIISKEGQIIWINILLEGKAGARDFKIIWHMEEEKK